MISFYKLQADNLLHSSFFMNFRWRNLSAYMRNLLSKLKFCRKLFCVSQVRAVMESRTVASVSHQSYFWLYLCISVHETMVEGNAVFGEITFLLLCSSLSGCHHSGVLDFWRPFELIAQIYLLWCRCGHLTAPATVTNIWQKDRAED